MRVPPAGGRRGARGRRFPIRFAACPLFAPHESSRVYPIIFSVKRSSSWVGQSVGRSVGALAFRCPARPPCLPVAGSQIAQPTEMTRVAPACVRACVRAFVRDHHRECASRERARALGEGIVVPACARAGKLWFCPTDEIARARARTTLPPTPAPPALGCVAAPRSVGRLRAKGLASQVRMGPSFAGASLPSRAGGPVPPPPSPPRLPAGAEDG